MDIKLRDYFAAKAMQVLLTKFNPMQYPLTSVAKDSYAVADAMVVESSK